MAASETIIRDDAGRAALDGYQRGRALADIAHRLQPDPYIDLDATVITVLTRRECELLISELEPLARERMATETQRLHDLLGLNEAD